MRRDPRQSPLGSLRVPALGAAALTLAALTCAGWTAAAGQQRTVRARVQPRPGAPAEEIEMGVHEVPVNPPSVPAAEAELADEELVLGVVVDGQAMAYPIRYLATVEVLNDKVGDASLAPTW